LSRLSPYFADWLGPASRTFGFFNAHLPLDLALRSRGDPGNSDSSGGNVFPEPLFGVAVEGQRKSMADKLAKLEERYAAEHASVRRAAGK